MRPVLRDGARLKAGDYERIDGSKGGIRLYSLSFVLLLALAACFWGLMANVASGSDLEVPRLKVPSVSGLEVEVARSRLEQLGFVVDVKFQPNEVVEKGLAFDQEPLAGAQLDQGDPVSVLISDGPLGLTVPSVVGQQEAEAANVLFRNGLVPVIKRVNSDTVRPGEVLSTSPDIGERVQRGGEVELRISDGPAPRVVPEILDKALTDGLVELGQAGLAIGDIDYVYDQEAPLGSIMETDPAAGTEVPRDMPIDLVVSGDPPTVSVPFFVGLRGSSATAIAEQNDLELIIRTEYVGKDDPTVGRVLSQGIPPATEVSPGSAVEIKVATVKVPATTTTSATTTTQER